MFNPVLEVPADMLIWMNKQSQSAFIGDMLRLIQRKGGLTQNQIDEIKKNDGELKCALAICPEAGPLSR